jgi:hypothetical protein
VSEKERASEREGEREREGESKRERARERLCMSVCVRACVCRARSLSRTVSLACSPPPQPARPLSDLSPVVISVSTVRVAPFGAPSLITNM